MDISITSDELNWSSDFDFMMSIFCEFSLRNILITYKIDDLANLQVPNQMNHLEKVLLLIIRLYQQYTANYIPTRLSTNAIWYVMNATASCSPSIFPPCFVLCKPKTTCFTIAIFSNISVSVNKSKRKERSYVVQINIVPKEMRALVPNCNLYHLSILWSVLPQYQCVYYSWWLL